MRRWVARCFSASRAAATTSASVVGWNVRGRARHVDDADHVAGVGVVDRCGGAGPRVVGAHEVLGGVDLTAWSAASAVPIALVPMALLAPPRALDEPDPLGPLQHRRAGPRATGSAPARPSRSSCASPRRRSATSVSRSSGSTGGERMAAAHCGRPRRGRGPAGARRARGRRARRASAATTAETSPGADAVLTEPASVAPASPTTIPLRPARGSGNPSSTRREPSQGPHCVQPGCNPRAS